MCGGSGAGAVLARCPLASTTAAPSADHVHRGTVRHDDVRAPWPRAQLNGRCNQAGDDAVSSARCRRIRRADLQASGDKGPRSKVLTVGALEHSTLAERGAGGAVGREGRLLECSLTVSRNMLAAG
jgi:hypothetical protein